MTKGNKLFNRKRINYQLFVLKTITVLILTTVITLGIYKTQIIINKTHATTATSITKSTDTQFNQGTTSDTTVSGSGTGAVVQLSGSAGPDGTLYRKAITIDNSSGSELIDYQLLIDEKEIGYWKMDETSWSGVEDEVIDSSGNNNHGTAQYNSSITLGKYNNGGNFDGTNDFVNIGPSSLLTGDNLQTITIYIDESGTLPDPNSPVIVIAAVGTGKPQQLLLVKKIVKKMIYKNIPSEIKFYRCGDNTRKKFLKTLIKQDVAIFVLIIEKQGQKIADLPENFAFVCSLILNDCLIYYKNYSLKIIFDRHFHRQIDRDIFDKSLQNILGQKLSISHVDSLQQQAVNTADMVAGSILWLRTGKDSIFYSIIKNKIVAEKIISWKEARRSFWHKKTRLNRRKRPSKSE